jgi:hypothetical protein
MNDLEMSPGATAIWEAYNLIMNRGGVFASRGNALATVLRTVADLVAPENMPECSDCCLTMVEDIRADLLTLATELGNYDD